MRKPGPNYFGFILWVRLIKVVAPVGRFCVFIAREIRLKQFNSGSN